MEIARQICKCAPLGLRATKIASMKFMAAAEKAGIDAIPEIRSTVLNSEDCKEGIKSFVERREAVFKNR
ncbi:enoyl-CoA hydratase [compost metagenome]